MELMGIADEASPSIEGQIRATKELGWKWIEAAATHLRVTGLAVSLRSRIQLHTYCLPAPPDLARHCVVGHGGRVSTPPPAVVLPSGRVPYRLR